MFDFRKTVGLVVLCATLVAGLALAEEAMKPSGTVTIDETQFAFIVGAAPAEERSPSRARHTRSSSAASA